MFCVARRCSSRARRAISLILRSASLALRSCSCHAMSSFSAACCCLLAASRSTDAACCRAASTWLLRCSKISRSLRFLARSRVAVFSASSDPSESCSNRRIWAATPTTEDADGEASDVSTTDDVGSAEDEEVEEEEEKVEVVEEREDGGETDGWEARRGCGGETAVGLGVRIGGLTTLLKFAGDNTDEVEEVEEGGCEALLTASHIEAPLPPPGLLAVE